MALKKKLNEKKIINLYKENWSASKIAKLFNVDVNTITKRLRDNDIEVKKKYRKYLINEDYFESINTEEKAYWIGFLMADGYNSGIYIRIDIQDEGHLEKLRDEIYVNNDMPVRNKKNKINNKNIYYLTIQNSKILKDVEKMGIVNKKSMITEYPNIEEKYDKYFIRGLFDGDGSLSYSLDGNYRRYTYAIVGSKRLLESVKNRLSKIEINIKIRKTKSIYELYIRGNRQILKALNWMYDGSNIKLDRKFEKYQDMLNYYKNKKNYGV